MKRRDFMKLSAATALGATVAAMAPSALAATELDQTNGDLHTTVDRKTAAMGLGDGKTFAYDPENPYLNVNVGLFHDAQVMVGGQNVGAATYYLPDGMDPWAPAVIVLTPDNTTARAFSGSVTGRMWRTVACKNKIAVVFFGPENGGSWNLSLSSAGRDDAAALDALYQLMRKKGVKLSGAFSMDKSHTALVGYKEGGAALCCSALAGQAISAPSAPWMPLRSRQLLWRQWAASMCCPSPATPPWRAGGSHCGKDSGYSRLVRPLQGGYCQ